MESRRAQVFAFTYAGPDYHWHDGLTWHYTQRETIPSTERALGLRYGGKGINGWGSITKFTILVGREKLEVLTEDLMKGTAQALVAKIDLEKCEKIADSQFNSHLDDILDMKEPDLFIDRARIEILARHDPGSDPFRNTARVAETIAAMIYNKYMFASGWKIVYHCLRDILHDGVTDSTIRTRLTSDGGLRTRYLVLYDIVDTLTALYHTRLSLLATTSPHFARYFTRNSNHEKGGPEFVFNWSQLKTLQKSFLDSIIVELCLPNSRFPDNILLLLLRDAIEKKSKKEQGVVSQAFWDALGDLSVIAELREMLDSVILGPEGEKWKKTKGELDHPQEYEDWLDAQAMPSHMKLHVSNWKDMVYPLEKTRSRPVLDDMWHYINVHYKSFTGKDLDTLWNLQELHERTPQWHPFKTRDGNPEGRSGKKGGVGKGNRNTFAFTNGDDSDSDGSMSSLQTTSDSSEAETGYESDEDEDVDYDEDEDHDEEDEDLLREFEREAMDAASAIPNFYNPNAPAPELDELAEEGKGNPLIKMLCALRGRTFSGDAALRSDKRAQPSHPFPDGKPPAAGKTPPRPQPALKSKKATVEEVEDEEAGGLPSASKKKKKKKPKKKKKKPAAGSKEKAEGDDEAGLPAELPTAAPTSPEPAEETATRPASILSTLGLNTTLATEPSATQLTHKYVEEEGITEKTKHRPRPASGDPAPIQRGKKDFPAQLMRDKKGDKHSFFSTLKWSSKCDLKTLLRTTKGSGPPHGRLEWENLVKVMTDMGFKLDSGMAGYSVRFDPPNPKDQPITLHKPHPGRTLHPVMLKKFGKRLNRNYGWSWQDAFLDISSSDSDSETCSPTASQRVFTTS